MLWFLVLGYLDLGIFGAVCVEEAALDIRVAWILEGNFWLSFSFESGWDNCCRS